MLAHVVHDLQWLYRWWLFAIRQEKFAATLPPLWSPVHSPRTPPPGRQPVLQQGERNHVIFFPPNRLQLVSMLLFLSWIILEARVLPILEVNRRSYLVFLKVDIAQVQHRGKNSKNWELVFRSKVKDLHGSTQTQIVICITLSFYSTVSSLSRREKRRTSKYKTNTYGGRVVSKLLVVNIILLPGWGNSRSQPPVGRTLASAVRADLPASRRRCDSSSHLWPETEIHTQSIYHFSSQQSRAKNIKFHVGSLCLHLEDNTGLFQQILRGYGTTDYTTEERDNVIGIMEVRSHYNVII